MRRSIRHAGAQRILIFAPSFEPAVKAGGPARTLTNLVGELNQQYYVDVVTPDRDLGDSKPFEGLSGCKVTRENARIFYLNASSPRQVGSLLRRLSRHRYDLIMVNSIWNHFFALGPVLLGSIGLIHGPILLLAHGELEPGALKFKQWKKRVAKPALRAIYMNGVDIFGATSESEARNIAGWFPGKPLVTSTNNMPDSIPWGTPSKSNGHLDAVYLSRIDRKKGLLPLLLGLGQVSHRVHLHVVGPAEDSRYWEQCQRAIAHLPPHATVTHTSLAERHEIPELLWNADCLVLLTAGENYGHVIAEALQAGCPVITTPTTPWTEVLRAGGGDIIAHAEDPLEVAAVLDKWAAKKAPELAFSRRLAKDAFTKFSEQSGPNIVELAIAALGAGSSLDARL